MHIVALVVSALSLLVVAAHERQWWLRRKWRFANGTVVAETERDESFVPEIEYEFNGKLKRFVSKYGGLRAGIGRQVRIVVDPITGDAEQLKFSNRWLPTIGILIFSLLWAWAGISTWPNAAQ